jgi:hypothetical protein
VKSQSTFARANDSVVWVVLVRLGGGRVSSAGRARLGLGRVASVSRDWGVVRVRFGGGG